MAEKGRKETQCLVTNVESLRPIWRLFGLGNFLYFAGRVGSICSDRSRLFSRSLVTKRSMPDFSFGSPHADMYMHDNLLGTTTDVFPLYNTGEDTNLRGTSTSIAASADDSLQNLLHSRMKKRITPKTISAISRLYFCFRISDTFLRQCHEPCSRGESLKFSNAM
jgi:hypothetical protein